jgi:hypothetical protein
MGPKIENTKSWVLVNIMHKSQSTEKSMWPKPSGHVRITGLKKSIGCLILETHSKTLRINHYIFIVEKAYSIKQKVAQEHIRSQQHEKI